MPFKPIPEIVKKKNAKKRKDEIERMRIFRANGFTYELIGKVLKISANTARKYSKDVVILPKRLRQNPFENIKMELAQKAFGKLVPTSANIRTVEDITDIDYFIEEYEIGTRFKGPLHLISLTQLQKLMAEPTNYHSTLKMKDWAKHYLGGKEGRFLMHSPHLWSKIQLEMFDLWEKHQRLMIETFRDAGKTMVADAILPHEICENRDNNYFVMSETDTKAATRVKHVGDVLLTNKRIIADYGFLPHIKLYEGHRQSWKQNEITVKREFKQTDPTLVAFSTKSSKATGMHFAGGVYDDIWSFNLEQNSLVNKDKWFGWYDGELEGCLENAWELFLLTRKGVTDLYQDLEDRHFYVVYKRPAVIKFPSKYEYIYKEVEGHKVFDYVKVKSKDYLITDDGNGRFSIEFFLEKKLKMDAVKWESEYQLNPIAMRGKFWDLNDLRPMDGYTDFMNRVRKKKLEPHLKMVGFMDLGFGKSSRSDFTALVILAFFEKKYHFLELYLKRGASENQLVEMCASAKKTFPYLRTIYMEADLQQSNKVERLQKKIKFVKIVPFLSRQEQAALGKDDSGKRANLSGKILRIHSQIEPLMEDNVLYYNRNMRNFKEFWDEMRTFPQCGHFDVIDALGNAISVLRKKSALIYAYSQ